MPYKRALEALLLELDDEAVDRFTQLQREARGTWLLALRVPQGERAARALLLGNALSGTSIVLAQHGFEVTLFDRSELRMQWAVERNAALSTGPRTRTALASGSHDLPFSDGEFDLVVQEDGLPSASRGWGHDLAELRRICAGELVVIADNRFAYKRSSGRRGVFDIPGPLAFLRRAVWSDERTLAAQRRLARARGFAPPRAFALYPHASEYTFVVGLDGAGPALELGPKERANKLKLGAHALGLFPWLAPSFAVISARDEVAATPPRWQRLLAQLAERTGERGATLEHVVATRGNSALLLTRGANDGDEGAWCVHIGLSAAQRSQLATHGRTLRELANSHPACPVPQWLAEGEFEGVFTTVERRARGLTAPQLTGDLAATRRTLDGLVEALASLVVTREHVLDEASFEALLGRRFDGVAAYAGAAVTVAELDRMRERARRAFVGMRIPLVVQHADLRSKHVQVERDGRLLALLDWGSAERADLPYFDLLHYLLHERKQADGLTAREMWRLALEPARLRDWERAALARYAGLLGLRPEFCTALADLYPVLVAAMAERHWDFSRPRWLRRQFGIGIERP
jgi:aminoglycoside phosphotransferase (APT) family kinase protein